MVRRGGFSQAAKVVFATQPTVSKAVKQLEDELGVPLLNRVGHRSELTAVGNIVYRRAVSLLSEGEDLIAELDELRGLKRGKLRLGFPRVGSSAVFAPMFASFRRRYPGGSGRASNAVEGRWTRTWRSPRNVTLMCRYDGGPLSSTVLPSGSLT